MNVLKTIWESQNTTALEEDATKRIDEEQNQKTTIKDSLEKIVKVELYIETNLVKIEKAFEKSEI